MIGSLQTWQWAATYEGSGLIETVGPAPTVAALSALRGRWSAEQIAVASEIAAARSRAVSKFDDKASRLIADREGLEMASSARAAGHKAARFAELLGPGAGVLDACCGIGGDTMGFTRAGLRVTAVDLDERRAWMAGHNAACDWEAGDARSIQGEFRGVHIDPARRSAGGRTHRPTQFEPPLDEMLPLLGSAEAGAIKLHPGVAASELPDGELEIISERGTLTQGVLWTGSAARAARTATVLDAEGVATSISGEPDRPDGASDIGTFVHTMDPSLERADLVGLLLRSVPLSLVFPGTGLLTGETPVHSPWLTAFSVVESMPWNLKAVRKHVRALDPGEVTVKTRAGAVDPDRLSRELRGDGARALTLFVLPIDGRPHAIIAERAPKQAPPACAETPDGARMGTER